MGAAAYSCASSRLSAPSGTGPAGAIQIADQRMIVQVLTDPWQIHQGVHADRRQVSTRPIPLSNRAFGEPSTPADSTTSESA